MQCSYLAPPLPRCDTRQSRPLSEGRDATGDSLPSGRSLEPRGFRKNHEWTLKYVMDMTPARWLSSGLLKRIKNVLVVMRTMAALVVVVMLLAVLHARAPRVSRVTDGDTIVVEGVGGVRLTV